MNSVRSPEKAPKGLKNAKRPFSVQNCTSFDESLLHSLAYLSVQKLVFGDALRRENLTETD